MAERYLVWDKGGEIPEEPLPDEDGNIDDKPGDVRRVYVPEIYMVTTPDGREIRFEVFGMFTNEEQTRQYMVIHEVGTPADEAAIVPYGGDEEGMVEFLDFEDDEEYEAAEARFRELFRGDIYGDNVFTPVTEEEYLAETGGAEDPGDR